MLQILERPDAKRIKRTINVVEYPNDDDLFIRELLSKSLVSGALVTNPEYAYRKTDIAQIHDMQRLGYIACNPVDTGQNFQGTNAVCWLAGSEYWAYAANDIQPMTHLLVARLSTIEESAGALCVQALEEIYFTDGTNWHSQDTADIFANSNA